MNTEKRSWLDPEKPLHNLYIFWISVIVPILVGLGMIFTTLPMSHDFAWSTHGLFVFWEVSKLQLAIISLALPFGTIVAVMHRSNQSAEQMRLSFESVKFNNFNDHRNAFFESFSSISGKINLNEKDVSKLYGKVFANSINFDYTPFVPEEWEGLFSFLEKSMDYEDCLDFHSLCFLEDLSDQEKINNFFDEKKLLLPNIFDALEKAVSVFRNGDEVYRFSDVYDISDDDDLIRHAEDMAKNCHEMFEMIKLVLKFIFVESFSSHFSDSRSKRKVCFFDNLSMSYMESIEGSDLHLFHGDEIPGLDNIYSLNSRGEIYNGKLVVLSVALKESGF